ncbi:MAG: serine/threonine-protein kinase, partial [Myxococcota bacterium]
MSDPPSQDFSTDIDEYALDADEASSLTGHTLAGRYVVRQKLGEGAMGQVYLGEHTLIKKPVAIKVLHPELSANKEVMARFQREAQASATINHPNLCAATDFGSTSRGEFFLVMEFLEGRTLEQLISAHGRLDERRVLFIIDQLCKVLDIAHTHGIIHRDLKPENLMLIANEDTEDFVKVMDFGIASMVEEGAESENTRLTRQGIAYGTPAYMSPEQVLGEDVDARSDLYTVGVILFEMLTGEVPFNGRTVKKVMSKHLTTPVPTMLEAGAPHVHPALESIVRKLMEKEPEDRIQSARQLRQALREITFSDLPWSDAAMPLDFITLHSGEIAIAAAPLPTAATAPKSVAEADSTIGWLLGRFMALPLSMRITLVA